MRRDDSWRSPAGETFTLYLRSFADDYTEVLRDGLVYRVWIVEPWMRVFRFVRFEDIVASTAWPFGRMVALGRPATGEPIRALLSGRPEATEPTLALSAAVGQPLLAGAERITAGDSGNSKSRNSRASPTASS